MFDMVCVGFEGEVSAWRLSVSQNDRMRLMSMTLRLIERPSVSSMGRSCSKRFSIRSKATNRNPGIPFRKAIAHGCWA